MKALRIMIVSFILIIGFLIAFEISSAIAGDYMGEFCWSIHITERENGPADDTYLTRYEATYMGGSHYMLSGIVEVPGDNPHVSQGTAKVIGNEIYITTNGAQNHSANPWRDTGTGQMRLNLSTLNGTFWGNILSFNTSTREFYPGYAAGEATLITCP